MNVVRAHFRPEFLNRRRRDHPLPSPEARAHGADRRHPDEAACRSCSTSARSRSTSTTRRRSGWRQKGYDPVYGARPLKRVIQKDVQDPLADMMLAGKIHDGETVKITAGKDGLTFNGAAAKAKAA